MNSIIISILTSLVVSNITFILGLKAGKNQSDRQIIKERYKKLYIHFNELLDGLNSINPKTWKDFKKIKTGINKTEYVPIVKEMVINGDAIELNKKFVDKLIDLEVEILKYEYCYSKSFLQIEGILLNKLKEHCTSIQYGQYDIRTRKDTIGWGTFQKNMGVFIVKSQLESLIILLNESEKSGISLKLNDNKSLYIYNNSLDNITLVDFLEECYEENIKRTETIELLKNKDNLRSQTNKILNQINKRVKEPFPVWKTFSGAFIDLFKT